MTVNSNSMVSVTHEINNTMAFVSSNFFILSQYMEDFKAILDAYATFRKELAEKMPPPSLPASVQQHDQLISRLEKDVDVDFLTIGAGMPASGRPRSSETFAFRQL